MIEFKEQSKFGNIFYGIITLAIQFVSIIDYFLTIRKLLYLNESLAPILSQIVLSLVFLIASFASIFGFIQCSFCSTENLSNDNNRLGDDLILTQESNSQLKQSQQTIRTLSTACPSIISNGSNQSTKLFSAEENIPFKSSSHIKIQPMQSTKSSFKELYVPPFNTIFHLLMAFCLLISKLILSKISKKEINISLLNEITKMPLNTKIDDYNRLIRLLSNTTNSSELIKSVIVEILNEKQTFMTIISLNTLEIRLEHLSYFMALFMFLFKITRFYSIVNKSYCFLVFCNLLIFVFLNLYSLSTLEFLYKSHEAPMRNFYSHLDILEYPLVLILSYFLSWILSILYYISFNIYLIYFYNESNCKLIKKYEFYYAKYYTQSDTCSQLNDSNQILTQYKAIIIGISIILLVELIQIPYLYTCYTKYFSTNIQLYFIALCFQLLYLFYNSILWIILSFKQTWSINFTAKYHIILWHYIYSNKLRQTSSFDSSNDKVTKWQTISKQDYVINRNQIEALVSRKKNELIDRNRLAKSLKVSCDDRSPRDIYQNAKLQVNAMKNEFCKKQSYETYSEYSSEKDSGRNSWQELCINPPPPHNFLH